MPEFSIGQIAAEMNLRASAIRYYESERLLAAPRRRSGRRIYDRSALERLALIELDKECGFSIAEIRALLCGFAERTTPAKRWRAMAKTKIGELNDKMVQISRMKSFLSAICRCQCSSVAECGQRARRAYLRRQAAQVRRTVSCYARLRNRPSITRRSPLALPVTEERG